MDHKPSTRSPNSRYEMKDKLAMTTRKLHIADFAQDVQLMHDVCRWAKFGWNRCSSFGCRALAAYAHIMHHRANCVKIWRHPQNRKYITYRIAVFRKRFKTFLFLRSYPDIVKQEAFEKCWAHSQLRAVLHCHSPGVVTVARRHCRTPPAHRCPRQRRQQQRQRVTEGTAMAT